MPIEGGEFGTSHLDHLDFTLSGVVLPSDPNAENRVINCHHAGNFVAFRNRLMNIVDIPHFCDRIRHLRNKK